jgi:UDP-N-acetylmuramate dehydrogenase
MDMSEVESAHAQPVLRGEVRMNEPMRRYTSWRVGGAARQIYFPADLADFAGFLQTLPQDEPVYVVGLGSNLLVRDGDVHGTVVVLHARLNELRVEQRLDRSGLVYAQAGVACAKAARFAASHNLARAEFLAGIPGTIGGALAMNAGCYGGETWGIVERVQTVSRKGRLRERPVGDYAIGYRHVALKGDGQTGKWTREPLESEEWFTGAWFRLPDGMQAESRQRIKEFLGKRIASQPLNLPNAGSVFRNPVGDKAARLIEQCGLKGFQVGGAMVSPKHANFIVNTGTATAADIEAVIMAVQKGVREKAGIELEPEVRIIGSVP